MRILVIEDDVKISRFIREGLEADGHAVETAHDGRAGLELALGQGFDLVLLDLMLPELSGVDFLSALREKDQETFVIALTALSDVSDRVRVLDLGADDYLTKPFSFVELRARIRSLFRRSGRDPKREQRVGDLRLDTLLRRASCGDKEVELSSREFRLLDYLAQTPDEPVTRAMIADRVWGYQFDTGTNVIEVYINYLRKKLALLGLQPIRTVRGIGYLLESRACSAEETLQ